MMSDILCKHCPNGKIVIYTDNPSDPAVLISCGLIYLSCVFHFKYDIMHVPVHIATDIIRNLNIRKLLYDPGLIIRSDIAALYAIF